MSAEPEDSFVSGEDDPERYNAIVRSRNPMTSNLDPADELFAIRNQIAGSLSRVDENGFVQTSGEFLQRITAYLDTLSHAGEGEAFDDKYLGDGASTHVVDKGEGTAECSECGATAEQWHKLGCSKDYGQQVKYDAVRLAPTQGKDAG